MSDDALHHELRAGAEARRNAGPAARVGSHSAHLARPRPTSVLPRGEQDDCLHCGNVPVGHGATVWVVQRVDPSHGDDLIAIYSNEEDARSLVGHYNDPQVQASEWDVFA